MPLTAPSVNALSVAVLALLCEGPRHPYDMFAVLSERREDVNVKLRRPSLYDAVGRLAADGYLLELGTDRDGNRPERRTYEITESGRTALVAAVVDRLTRPVNDYPAFPVGLRTANTLPVDDVVDSLTARAKVIESDLPLMREGMSQVIGQGVPRNAVLDVDYLITMKQAELDWLHQLLNLIASGDLPWISTNEKDNS